MAEKDIRRMASSVQSSNNNLLPEWEDLPEYIMRRDPELRLWNDRMKQKFLIARQNMFEFARSVQEI